jgi:hypothetical protein
MAPENFRKFVSKLHFIRNHGADTVYQPLKRERIQIVTIQPGEFDDKIIIGLAHAKFSARKHPKYEALSYVWGSSSNRKRIHIAGVPNGSLEVTHNLYVALKYLRYVDKSRTMWIDAICIIQENNVEKSLQVALMCDIYRLADRVVFWLGPEANDDYMGLCSRLEAFVRTLCQDDFAELRDPPLPSRSNFEADKQYLTDLVLGRHDHNDISIEDRVFLNRVSNSLNYRRIFETPEEHIGLGTLSAKLGDQIIVIIGCAVAKLVRPLPNGEFSVVGACYTCGISYGEALLGQLPDGIKIIHRLNKESGVWKPEFKNTKTGGITL